VDWGSAAEIAVAALAVLAAGLKLIDVRTRVPRRRRQLMHNLDLRDRLAENSDARKRLEGFIDKAVIEMVIDETEKRRDPTGVVLAGLLLAAAGWAAYQYWAHDGHWAWLLLAGSLAVIGVVGMAQDVVPRRRDERGRPIRQAKAS
jgi:hypothetical protein